MRQREMHDLGSAQELPARPQTVTPGSIRGLTQKNRDRVSSSVDAPIPPGRSHAPRRPDRSGGTSRPPETRSPFRQPLHQSGPGVSLRFPPSTPHTGFHLWHELSQQQVNRPVSMQNIRKGCSHTQNPIPCPATSKLSSRMVHSRSSATSLETDSASDKGAHDFRTHPRAHVGMRLLASFIPIVLV